MDQGNTAFVLLTAALVLLMTPGLAFFYGGLVKAKSVISMMMMSFGAIGLIAVLWVLYGYSIAFSGAGSDTYVGIDGFIGFDTANFGLTGLLETPEGAAFPPLAFAAFQATFAIITVALVSGAIADRAKFGSWLIFAGVWATVVYFPVASWVFNFTLDPETLAFTDGGWATYGLQEALGVGVIDFAGGTAVHINAGAAGLALALVLGRRVGFQKGAPRPAQPAVRAARCRPAVVRMVRLQRGLGARRRRHRRSRVRQHARRSRRCAARLADRREDSGDGKATSVGAASGAVAGLVAITPACASLHPLWAIVLGLIAGAICALAIDLKFKLGFDDSLDVVGIHLIGGLVGTLYLGFLANGTGLFFSGDGTQLLVQAIVAFSVAIFSFVLAYVIGLIIEKTIGFRVKNEDEIAGIDLVVHGEEGYVLADSKA